MISKETVLVLGAGASVDYGYPTGATLIGDIINTICNTQFKDGDGQYKLIGVPTYKKLVEKLNSINPTSIDDFLTKHAELEMQAAGKQAIAYQILVSENSNKVGRFEDLNLNSVSLSSSQNQNKDWYRFLIEALISQTTIEELLNQKIRLKIITFNYDNSLEYALLKKLSQSAYLKDHQKEFYTAVAENIIHIYGQIGRYIGIDTNRDYIAYGKYKNQLALEQASILKNSIAIVGEERSAVKDNAQIAQEWLKSAKRIFFLGYGFNDDNNKLLSIKESCENADEIYCTNFGGSQKLSKKICELFNLQKTEEKPDGTQIKYTRQPSISAGDVYSAIDKDFELSS